MVRIRLSRKGKKKMPTYRIVVADIKFKRDGRYIENVGHYNPHTNPSTVVLKEDRILHWLSVGAQPTDAVKRFLEKRGTYDKLKRVHAGESIESLMAESEGAAPAEAAEEAVAAVVSEAAEEVEDAVEEAVEVAEEVVEETAEAVEEVAEEVEEAAEAVADAEEAPADESEEG